MKKVIYFLLIATLLLALASPALADRPVAVDQNGVEVAWAPNGAQCVKIQDGTLTYATGHYLAGQPLKVGFNIFGVNYQSHLFDGYYANNYLGREGFPPYAGDDEAYRAQLNDAARWTAVQAKWYWPYRTTRVLMKWSDSWISNTDCGTQSPDGGPYSSQNTPDGFLDRHYGSDSYVGSGAWETNHMWDSYVQDGQQCKWNDFYKIAALPATGTPIWGEFSIIEEVYNDSCAEYHGLLYKSLDHAGFGGW